MKIQHKRVGKGLWVFKTKGFELNSPTFMLCPAILFFILPKNYMKLSLHFFEWRVHIMVFRKNILPKYKTTLPILYCTWSLQGGLNHIMDFDLALINSIPSYYQFSIQISKFACTQHSLLPFDMALYSLWKFSHPGEHRCFTFY